MKFDFNANMPIFLQIIERIKLQIIRKELSPGQKLPSVRDLSLQYSVNPNTVQKALSQLEDEGLIFTERTNGKYVTLDCEVIKKQTERTIENKLDEFCRAMAELGLNKNEIIKKDPSFGKIVCRCEQITEGEIIRAITQNPKATDIDGVKRRTRAGMGRCQGGFCGPYVMKLIAEQRNIPLTEVTKSGKGSEMVDRKI